MKPIALKMKCVLALVVCGILAVGSVMADQGGKDERLDRRDEQRGERRDDNERPRHGNDRHSTENGRHFEERQHRIVRDYYTENYHGGHCPHGLAKKHNGCMPKGQANKWQVGQPLAREVIYYNVPQPLLVQIGPPPTGHRYVRVASDILLIAIGTGTVVDAIHDLGRM